MEYTVTHSGADTRVALKGSFTFTDNSTFKSLLSMLDDKSITSMTLEFSQVDFIDSAGLGMLLLLRDECLNRNITVSIASARGQVEKIFLISKFDQLFILAS